MDYDPELIACLERSIDEVFQHFNTEDNNDELQHSMNYWRGVIMNDNEYRQHVDEYMEYMERYAA